MSVQYIDWDAEFKAACDIVETVPGLKDTIDTGDLREVGAPCGCWIAYSCSHPSAVGLCNKHMYEMPMRCAMPVYDDKWEDAHLDQFQVGPSWFHQRRIETALTQLMTS